MIDYHVHSTHSGDAPALLRDTCVRAVEIGLTEIAFTEHLDFSPTDVSYQALDYPKWFAEIEAAREEFEGRLTVLAGVEVDYQAKYLSKIEDYLGSHHFDYVLGAAHYVNGTILEAHEDYFPGKNMRDAYLPYFAAVRSAVDVGLFDTVAHLDICKRYGVRYYGKFPFEEFRPEIEDILRAIIRQGTALEINTSGLRQPPGETYPGIETIRLYAELGGRKIAVGSDSHQVHHLGMGLEEAMSMLSEAGLPQPVRFPLALDERSKEY